MKAGMRFVASMSENDKNVSALVITSITKTQYVLHATSAVVHLS